jgi:hypothetical protein
LAAASAKRKKKAEAQYNFSLCETAFNLTNILQLYKNLNRLTSTVSPKPRRNKKKKRTIIPSKHNYTTAPELCKGFFQNF